jgi:hypothetical protein
VRPNGCQRDHATVDISLEDLQQEARAPDGCLQHNAHAAFLPARYFEVRSNPSRPLAHAAEAVPGVLAAFTKTFSVILDPEIQAMVVNADGDPDAGAV